jgi:hypothetical protein
MVGLSAYNTLKIESVKAGTRKLRKRQNLKPRPVTDRDLAFWKGKLVMMKAPPESEDIGDLQCVLVIDDAGNGILQSPWVLDERDYQDSALSPFTVWLQCWGGMPPTDIIILKNGVGEASENSTSGEVPTPD